MENRALWHDAKRCVLAPRAKNLVEIVLSDEVTLHYSQHYYYIYSMYQKNQFSSLSCDAQTFWHKSIICTRRLSRGGGQEHDYTDRGSIA